MFPVTGSFACSRSTKAKILSHRKTQYKWQMTDHVSQREAVHANQTKF